MVHPFFLIKEPRTHQFWYNSKKVVENSKPIKTGFSIKWQA